MRPIGGYFELECGNNPSFYPDGIYLNSCRNGIRYLIRALGISEIYVPYFTCDVVFQAISQESCKIRKYHIDEAFMPDHKFSRNDFIIYNNYFGVMGEKVKELANIYPNLIVDNAQAFYSQPECRAAIYSPRKFFGLPDGGILRGKDLPYLDLPTGTSYEVCSHLLKRIDLGPQAGYTDFISNDSALQVYPVEYMSKLTTSLMGNIAYERAKKRRINNFKFLYDRLSSTFPFSLSDDDVPMVFPYITYNDNLRKTLIENDIFIAKYWPNITTDESVNLIERNLTDNLLAIPLDQRYTPTELNNICEIISRTH